MIQKATRYHCLSCAEMPNIFIYFDDNSAQRTMIMLGETEPTFELLFEQLGLSSNEEDIDAFIRDHQISADTNMVDAPYWNEGQRQFLRQKLIADDHWVMIVDDLNQRLHEDAQKKQSK